MQPLSFCTLSTNGTLSDSEKKRWGHVDCFALTADNDNQLILVWECKYTQWHEGWKPNAFPSPTIHWILGQRQLRWSTDNSDTALCNHLCLCRLYYGGVCKIQWSQMTRLDGPGCSVPTLVLSFRVFCCCCCFGGGGDGRGFQWKGWRPIEVKHVTSAKGMHM